MHAFSSAKTIFASIRVFFGSEKMVSKRLLLVFVCAYSLLSIRVAHANPPVGTGFFSALALLVTIFIEAYGLWFLLKSLNVLKERSMFTRLQCFGIAVVLNLVTFLVGYFVFLPLSG